MEVHNTSGPVVVMRYNLYAAAAITVNPAPAPEARRRSPRCKASPIATCRE